MACSTCARADLADVNAALAALGAPGAEGFNAIARRFGIAKPSLARHRDGCVRKPASAPPVAIVPAAPVAPAVTEEERWEGVRSRGYFHGRPGPGRVCSVCRSPVRAAIEAALGRGEPWFTIARTVEGAPSHDAIRNHARKCIPRAVREAIEGREIGGPLRVVEDLADVREAAMQLLGEAQQLVHEAREVHERAGKAAHCEACGFGAEAAAEIQASTLLKIRTAAEIAAKASRILQIVGRATGEIAIGAGDIAKHPAFAKLARLIGEAVADCDACSRAVELALDPPGERAAAA